MKHSLQLAGLVSAGILVPIGALVWIWNPWFLDTPWSFALQLLLPLMVPGLLLGTRLSRVPGGWSGGAVAVVAGLLALVRPMPGPAQTELLIVGMDGVTWAVADSLSLPNLERARAEGKSGVLIAEPPLFSPLLWTTMATGKRPEEHGIHGFRVRADQATSARFWEIARGAGKTVGLYKWLVTWPPPQGDVPGFVVPAWLAPDAQTHPMTLSWVKELELSRRVHRKRVAAVRPVWRLGLEGVLQGVRWSTVWATVRSQARTRLGSMSPKDHTASMRRLRVLIDRDLFVAQLHTHRPQIASFTMYATDALGHTHWGLQGNAVVHNAYQLSDEVLGELRREVGPQATVMVVSDHGFRAARPEDREHRRQPTTSALEARVQAEVGPVEVARVGHKLALTWLGDDPQAGRAALITWLKGFVVDGSQRPLFRWEAIPERDRALGLTLADDAFDSSSMEDTTVQGAPLLDYVRLAAGQAGEHDDRGIAVLVGPNIEAGDLGVVSQLDVTPTVLSALGLPAASDMPGKSWIGDAVPRVDSYDSLAPAQTDEPATVNEENLRALGYVE